MLNRIFSWLGLSQPEHKVKQRQAAAISTTPSTLDELPKAHLDVTNLLPLAQFDREVAFKQTVPLDEWQAFSQQLIEILPAHEEVFGGVNPGDRRVIYYTVRYLKPKRVLEVGTHVGASTVNIAGALKVLDNGGELQHQLTTVDILDVNQPNGPWSEYNAKMPPIEALRQIKADDRVQFIAQPAMDFLTNTSDLFDLIFLDGDHSAIAVYKEVEASLKLLNPGGMILLHDFYPDGVSLWPGKQEAIVGPYQAYGRYRQEDAPIQVLPLGELPWETKLGTNLTSLALLGSK